MSDRAAAPAGGGGGGGLGGGGEAPDVAVSNKACRATNVRSKLYITMLTPYAHRPRKGMMLYFANRHRTSGALNQVVSWSTNQSTNQLI